MVPLALIVAVACAAAPPVPVFTDIGASAGILPHETAMGMTSGAAIVDADGDGDLDLFLPAGRAHPNRFYENDGAGLFTDVAPELGLDRVSWNDRAAIFFDYDGDHDLDLVIGSDDHVQDEANPSTLSLFRRDADGAYVDVTANSGLFGQLYEPGVDPMNHLSGLVAGDVNDDGRLDLLLTHWRGYAFLFMNQGDGTFSDQAAARGLETQFDTYWQPLICDFDGDGAMDIFCAVDFTRNQFYINHGDGTFHNDAEALGLVNDGGNDMGAALGDFDSDGDLDLFVSNIFGPKYDQNHLWRNDSTVGSHAFTDVAIQVGVADAHWGWGSTFADADHDGRVDLFVTNGYFGFEDPTMLFHQQATASPTFVDVALKAGIDDRATGAALLAADLDGDLDLEVLQVVLGDGAAPRLWRNDHDAMGDALIVRPRMEGSNHFAIGATVRVTVDTEAGEYVQAGTVCAGTSMLGQEPAEVHFGLNGFSSADRVDELEIRWPGGDRTVLYGVESGQSLTVIRWLCPGDVDESGSVDSSDLVAMLGAWGQAGYARTDVNGDGHVDVADILELLARWGACG